MSDRRARRFWCNAALDIAPTRFTVEAPALSADMLWRVAVLGIACAAMSIVFARPCTRANDSYPGQSGTLTCALPGAASSSPLPISAARRTTTAPVLPSAPAPSLRARRPPGLCAEAPLYGCHARLRLPRRRGRSDLLHRRDARLRPGSASGHTGGLCRGGGPCCALLRAVNCPVASVILAVELFLAREALSTRRRLRYCLYASGYTGLYSSQKIMYSKLRAEFIDIHAK